MIRFLAIVAGLVFGAQGSAAQPVSAVLEPVQFVEMRSVVAGRVAVLKASEGQDVKGGATLAQIDARVQQARVDLSRIAAEAKGAEERASILVLQAEKLNERVLAARAKRAAQPWEVTQAKQALELARADQRIALETASQLKAQLLLEEATLKEFTISAPFDGTVFELMVEQGEIIDTQTPVMAFGNLDRLKATAFLPIDWLPELEVGGTLPAQLKIGGETLGAEIVSIDPRIDPASLSVRIRVEIENPGRRIFAGSILLLEQN